MLPWSITWSLHDQLHGNTCCLYLIKFISILRNFGTSHVPIQGLHQFLVQVWYIPATAGCQQVYTIPERVHDWYRNFVEFWNRKSVRNMNQSVIDHTNLYHIKLRYACNNRFGQINVDRSCSVIWSIVGVVCLIPCLDVLRCFVRDVLFSIALHEVRLKKSMCWCGCRSACNLF